MIESSIKSEAVATLGAVALAVSIALGAATHAGAHKQMKQVAQMGPSAELRADASLFSARPAIDK